jgi:hypothetical protein
VVSFFRPQERHHRFREIRESTQPGSGGVRHLTAIRENWQFYKTMRDAAAMHGRGSVLTTTNKARLDEVVGSDSHAL